MPAPTLQSSTVSSGNVVLTYDVPVSDGPGSFTLTVAGVEVEFTESADGATYTLTPTTPIVPGQAVTLFAGFGAVNDASDFSNSEEVAAFSISNPVRALYARVSVSPALNATINPPGND